MKPVIFYVDDEAMNLMVFEAAMEGDYQVKTFDSPIAALQFVSEYQPAVILSDQRMPGTTGVQFLELCSKLSPKSQRILVSGFSDEGAIIDSIKKAQIFDFIRKPWNEAELKSSVSRAISFYNLDLDRERILRSLREREAELIDQNQKLSKLSREIEAGLANEKNLRQELQSWVHPYVLQLTAGDVTSFPFQRNLVGITFDIISSSELHKSQNDHTKSVRARTLRLFNEIVLKFGGCIESSSGDSCYAHFGLLGSGEHSLYDAAMGAAREFRTGMRSLSEMLGVPVEVGIALHDCRDCAVNLHVTHAQTPNGPIVQKSFDTSSPEIDLLHRMEKLLHQLPGSNIIMSGGFKSSLSTVPSNLRYIGMVQFKGQSSSTAIHIIPSDKVRFEDFDKMRESLGVALVPEEQKKTA